MANSNLYFGSIKIKKVLLGLREIKLFLGTNTVYPTSVPLTDAIVTCDGATYNAQLQVAQNIAVTLSGVTLVENVDYIVTNNSGGTNVGSYVVEITGINNYESTANGTFTISKVTPKVTSPTAKDLTYNGTSQALVNAGSTDYGTLKYSLDNVSYSTTIPSGINATAYTVYYRVDGIAT